MTAFTLYAISISLFIIGSALAFPPLVAPHLLGRRPTDFQFNIAWLGRVLIGVSIMFSVGAFVVSKAIA